MDSSTTIIGLLLLAIFVFPVLFISRSGKSKGKKFEKDFFSEVSRNELNISEKDFCNEFAIGIDTSMNRIIYIDWSGPDRMCNIFDLKDVKVFESIPSSKEQNKKNYSFKNVDKLNLKFHFKESVKPDLNIIFYRAGFGKITDEEIRLFKKWSGIIRNIVETKSIDDFRHTA